MNAIILAAGLGLRMRDLSLTSHKALLPIASIPNIERIIRYLHEVNICDITIVTGYKHTYFTYLIEKYQIELVYNKDFALCNNLVSLEMVLNRLSDTFIINADIVLFKNLFKIDHLQHSFFYTIFKESNGAPTTVIETNHQRVIKKYYTYAGDKTVVTHLGISYWNQKDACALREYFYTNIHSKIKKQFGLHWEDVILDLSIKISMQAHQVDRKYARDLNSLEDYLNVCCLYDTFWKK